MGGGGGEEGSGDHLQRTRIKPSAYSITIDERYLSLTASNITVKVPISFKEPDWKHSADEQTLHLTLMMTSAQVIDRSVTITDNSPFQDYPHTVDHTIRSNKEVPTLNLR